MTGATVTLADGTRVTIDETWPRGGMNGTRRQACMRAHVLADVRPLLDLRTLADGRILEAACGCLTGVDRSVALDADGLRALADSMRPGDVLAVAAFENGRTIGAGYGRGGIIPECPNHNGTPTARAGVIGRLRHAAERVARAFGTPA